MSPLIIWVLGFLVFSIFNPMDHVVLRVIPCLSSSRCSLWMRLNPVTVNSACTSCQAVCLAFLVYSPLLLNYLGSDSPSSPAWLYWLLYLIDEKTRTSRGQVACAWLQVLTDSGWSVSRPWWHNSVMVLGESGHVLLKLGKGQLPLPSVLILTFLFIFLFLAFGNDNYF